MALVAENALVGAEHAGRTAAVARSPVGDRPAQVLGTFGAGCASHIGGVVRHGIVAVEGRLELGATGIEPEHAAEAGGMGPVAGETHDVAVVAGDGKRGLGLQGGGGLIAGFEVDQVGVGAAGHDAGGDVGVVVSGDGSGIAIAELGFAGGAASRVDQAGHAGGVAVLNHLAVAVAAPLGHARAVLHDDGAGKGGVGGVV